LVVPDQNIIPVICGPTGSGKTAVAVALSRSFPIEIVSADSRQIIKHLNIGTAKPTVEEQALVRFHLIDLVEPGERYSAAHFIDDADRAITQIIDSGRTPIVVGGTGLYLRALIEGVVEIESSNSEIREELERLMAELGPEEMHRRLCEVDPVEAAGVHPHNRVRVLRALEIYKQTGRAKSELLASGAYKKSSYEFATYCLLPEREALYEAINRRVDLMMQQGLLEEIDRLLELGLRPALRRANVIGYDELLDYRDEQCSLVEAIEQVKQNSRRYAKRQVTWFRHQMEGRVFASRESLQEVLGKSLLESLKGR
jgi:tRNA dimethylallyltransferase